MNSRLGRSMLRGLRRAAEFVVALLERIMRDEEMPPGAGRGIHATKSGSLYVDLDEIRNSPGSMEAARRGDSVLSAGYRPLHCGAENLNKSWTVRCISGEHQESELMLKLPLELAEFLKVEDGSYLTITSIRSNTVTMRTRPIFRSN